MVSLKGVLSITFMVSLSWLHVSLDSSSSIHIPTLSEVVKVHHLHLSHHPPSRHLHHLCRHHTQALVPSLPASL